MARAVCTDWEGAVSAAGWFALAAVLLGIGYALHRKRKEPQMPPMSPEWVQQQLRRGFKK